MKLPISTFVFAFAALALGSRSCSAYGLNVIENGDFEASTKNLLSSWYNPDRNRPPGISSDNITEGFNSSQAFGKNSSYAHPYHSYFPSIYQNITTCDREVYILTFDYFNGFPRAAVAAIYAGNFGWFLPSDQASWAHYTAYLPVLPSSSPGSSPTRLTLGVEQFGVYDHVSLGFDNIALMRVKSMPVAIEGTPELLKPSAPRTGRYPRFDQYVETVPGKTYIFTIDYNSTTTKRVGAFFQVFFFPTGAQQSTANWQDYSHNIPPMEPGSSPIETFVLPFVAFSSQVEIRVDYYLRCRYCNGTKVTLSNASFKLAS